jgi:hypothetical protein
MPFKPQNKILIHHIQTKEYMHYYMPVENLVQNIISAHASCARFFFKKIRPWKIKKITVAHGTSLAIYNTEACTFRYMMNIMIYDRHTKK